MTAASTPDTSGTDWSVIANPVTGETITFLERSPERLVFEVVFEPGSEVTDHAHPGSERFDVQKGQLTLRVGGVDRNLREGESYTVTSEFHAPRNETAVPITVQVTCEPGSFAERGLRGIFGLYRDGLIDETGRPRDVLAMALLTENGAFVLPGMPRPVWKTLMTLLGFIARRAGKQKLIERYWPPDLERPRHWR